MGKVTSGVRSNIIPEDLTMEGTIRTLDSKMQDDVHARMKLTAEKIAEASGATAEVKIERNELLKTNGQEYNTVKSTLSTAD